MSTDANSERPLGEEINAIFEARYGETRKGRIELAAHAISGFVNDFDLLKQQQEKSHEAVGSASRFDTALYSLGYSSAFTPVVLPSEDASEKTAVERILELFDENEDDEISLFSPLEKAELALSASIDGIRAAHNLSRRQARRAIALTRKHLR